MLRGGRMAMKICYFVTEYPAVSHTFIRREIVELERGGLDVLRVSLRRDRHRLVDAADLDEKERTRYLLDESAIEFARAFLMAALKPATLLRAVRAAFAMMRRSHRARVLHLAYLAEAIVLSRWLERGQVRHIHAHFGTNGAEVAMFAHLLTGIPYSFTVHGPDEFDRPEYLGLAEKVRRAAFVCAVSSFTRSQLCRWVPASEWGKIHVVRCGLGADFTLPRLTTKVAKNSLVCVGRLSAQKGQMVLLEAIALLAKQGAAVRLTLAGDGPLRSELSQRVRELNLERLVEMPGWLTNAQIRERLLDARALVLPSFAEGLPVALMEALALGRPVITTYVAGTPELVRDGLCGWLVPAGSAEKLADAIKECLDASDAAILRMGQAGRARVLDMHDIERECAKLATLIGVAAPAAASAATVSDRERTQASSQPPAVSHGFK